MWLLILEDILCMRALTLSPELWTTFDQNNCLLLASNSATVHRTWNHNGCVWFVTTFLWNIKMNSHVFQWQNHKSCSDGPHLHLKALTMNMQCDMSQSTCRIDLHNCSLKEMLGKNQCINAICNALICLQLALHRASSCGTHGVVTHSQKMRFSAHRTSCY